MHRTLLALALGAAVAVAGCRLPGARADRRPSAGPPPPDALAEGTRSMSVAAAWLDSTGDEDDDIELAALRVGLGERFRDGFEVGGELGLGHYDESGKPGAGSTVGLGVSGFLRWHALRGATWSAFLETGVGLVVADDEVPLGGTEFNGTAQVGAGATLDVGDGLRMIVGLRQQHLSNGKGTGDGNPAWDGFGAYLGLAWDVTPTARQAAPLRPRQPADPWRHALRVDLRGGEQGGESAFGGVVAGDLRIAGGLYGQLRGALDAVDGDALKEAGAALYWREAHGLFGVAYDRQELDVFEDDELSAFAEYWANDLVTVTAVVGHEDRNLSPTRAFGGVGFRLYLAEGFAAEIGVAAREDGDDPDPSAFDVPIALEWSPVGLRRRGLSLYLEDDVNDETRVLGLRWTTGGAWGPTGSLRERDRSSGPRRTRP